MSDFSDLLKEYLSKKNRNVISMARYCHTDKSTMYKILNASRLPASEDLVSRISGFLQLTPDEAEQLMESYRIAREGKVTYFRRKEVERFLAAPPVRTDYSISLKTAGAEDDVPPIRMYHHPHSVDSSLYEAILHEAEKGNGRLSLYLTDADERFSLFTADVLKKYPDLGMDYIIMINDDNHEYSDDSSGYMNLKKLYCLLPLISQAENRHFYYTCGSVCGDTHLPYFTNILMTGDTVILFNNGHTRSMCIRDPQICSEYREIYADARAASRILVPCSGAPDLSDIGSGESGMHIRTVFDMYPYFDLICGPTEQSHGDAAEQKRKSMMQNDRVTMIHCFDGYRSFMDTGILKDSDGEPLGMAERTALLQKYIRNIDRMHLYVLKKAIGPVTDGFTVILHDNALTLCFRNQEGSAMAVRLDEYSYYEAFDDFMDFLIRKSDLFYTKAELMRKLAELPEQYGQ